VRTQRTITATVVCLASLSAAMPTAAAASPLLSGYGGPGQGNQAILGSSLLNVPGNGGGPGTGAVAGANGGASPTAAGESAPAGASRGASESAPAGLRARAVRASESSAGLLARAHALARAARGNRPGGGLGVASGSPTRVRPASVGSEPLGLRGEYILFILLVLAALVLIAFLTRRTIGMSTIAGRDGKSHSLAKKSREA
jgi:hypothetical protein